MFLESLLHTTKDKLHVLSGRAYAPYSGMQQSCIFVFADGTWIPGVRVENASYPLTITAFHNAWSTSLGVGQSDPIAVIFDRTPNLTEVQIMHSFFPKLTDAKGASDGGHLFCETGRSDFPELDPEPVQVRYSGKDMDKHALMAVCKANASTAVVNESEFPVSCLLLLKNSDYILGTNIESPYWPFILCAERNALSTAYSYGFSEFSKLLLSCPNDPEASPCGACRQVICELAFEAKIFMDRANDQLEQTGPVNLLPGPFLGENLRK